MNIGELQRFQQRHDSEFHKDVMSFSKEKQIEHSTFHLAKLTGILATYCEKSHHGEAVVLLGTKERIADILVFALKLSNLFDVDLEKSSIERIKRVEKLRKK